MRFKHEWTEDKATIYVESLHQKVSLVHLTDQHVAEVDERDAAQFDICEQRRLGWENECAEKDGTPVSTALTFRQSMATVSALRADIVALTGDIIDFPSAASVDHALQSMGQVDAPILYVPGNHDWTYPDGSLTVSERQGNRYSPPFPYSPDARNQPGSEAQTHALRCEILGLQFLLINNSTYQVSDEQLEFVSTYLANGIPTVILQHIPISLPGLRRRTMEVWNAPILLADPEWSRESREVWGTGEDLESTRTYVSCLRQAETLVAILCGHVHFRHAEFMSPQAVQYVGAPGYEAQINFFEFLPMPTTPAATS